MMNSLAIKLLFAIVIASLFLSVVSAHQDQPLAGEISTQKGQLATEVELDDPVSLAMSPSGTLYISTAQGLLYRMNLQTGFISPLFQEQYFAAGTILLNHDGLLIAAHYPGCEILAINVETGTIKVLAGDYQADNPHCKTSGDGGLAKDASFLPNFIALDGKDNLFIADPENRRIRRVDGNSGLITTVAGSDKPDSTGDGGPAMNASLYYPTSVAVDLSGNLFIGQAGHGRGTHAIRRVDARTGVISTLAGSDFGVKIPLWDELKEPRALFSDRKGNLYVLEKSRVQYVDFAKHSISKVAGTEPGFAGDGGPAINAKLHYPSGIVFDSMDNLYIADFSNNRVRKIEAKSGMISTIAGNGKGPPPPN